MRYYCRLHNCLFDRELLLSLSVVRELLFHYFRKGLLIVHTLCVSLGYTEHNGEVSNLLKCYWSVDAVVDRIHSVFPLFSGFQHVHIVKVYIFTLTDMKFNLKFECSWSIAFVWLFLFIAIHCFVFIRVDLCGMCRIPLQTLFRWVIQYLATERRYCRSTKPERINLFMKPAFSLKCSN